MEKSLKVSLLHGTFFQNFLEKNWHNLSKYLFPVFLNTTIPSKVILAISKPSEITTNYRKNASESRSSVYVRFQLDNIRYKPSSLQHFISVFFSEIFVFQLKIRSKIAKMSYFYLMTNICCIWNLPGGIIENPWFEKNISMTKLWLHVIFEKVNCKFYMLNG